MRGATPERMAVAAEVRRLREDDHLVFRQIAERLGISRSYASSLYADPDGSAVRLRKETYRGACVECGAPTDGSNGRGRAPERCERCARARAQAERKWTQETISDAIRRFARVNGRPPLADEWINADPVNGYPPRSAVYASTSGGNQPFPSWADAIEAAGFPRPVVGRYARRPRGVPARKRRVYTSEGRKVMRDYIVLELDEDGRWIQHGPIQSYSEALAIEKHVETLGDLNGKASHRFVAVSTARWIVRELRPVTSFKAVISEAVGA